ncbi:MAG: hemolysin family protein [Alphaproteobacteria bacterium]
MSASDSGGRTVDDPPSPENQLYPLPEQTDQPSGGQAGWLRRALRSLLGRRNGETLREAIEELVEDAATEELDPEDGSERALIINVLRLHDITVEDVMVPRPDIVALEIETPLEEVIEIVRREAHSRMPVYRDSLDHLTGFVHIKDLMDAWGATSGFSLEPIVRDMLFVPPSMRVLELLAEMRQSRTHIAIVVDEFGGVDGLVTIEDLVEQIVGDIQDEHEDDSEPVIDRRPDGSVVADGRAQIETFEEEIVPFATADERAEFDTLGGLVFALADRVPTPGDVLRHQSGVEFEVLDADPRRIRKLRVSNLPAAD